MQSSGLASILNDYFDWNKARMQCFAGMLLALIKVRTVNLAELACAFESSAKMSSRYQRIKNFFREFTVDLACIPLWVVRLFSLADKPFYLTLDRTNWCWEKTDINIIILAAVYKGIALPLVWQLLPHGGNSDTVERIGLLKRFIAICGKSSIAGLLADREFIGGDWIRWLQTENISFCIRIKNNTVTTNRHGLNTGIYRLFWGLKPGEQICLKGQRHLWKQAVYLSAVCLPTGKLLYLASDCYLENPAGLYGLRWQIETLFGCLKSKGFCFEATHITRPERIEKLLVLLTIAFCWAHKMGEWQHAIKPIPIKKHGRKLHSYFRYGLDYLRDILLQDFQQTRKSLSSLFEYLRVENHCLEGRL